MVTALAKKKQNLPQASEGIYSSILAKAASRTFTIAYNGAITLRTNLTSLPCPYIPYFRSIHSYMASSINCTESTSTKSSTTLSERLATKKQAFEDSLNEECSYLSEHWLFSKENRDMVLGILSYVIETTEELHPVLPHVFLKYVLAYAKLQRISRRFVKIQTIPFNQDLLLGLENLNKFSKYAVGVYGGLLPESLSQAEQKEVLAKTTKKEQFLMFCDVKPEDLIVFKESCGRYLPAHALVLNHDLKAVILAIRGTEQTLDVFSDLDGNETCHELKDWKTGEVLTTGLVHKGIYRCAKDISDLIKNTVIEQLTAHPDYTLYVTGHSLGAGTAVLLTMIWLGEKEIMQKGLRCLAYASPPVISKHLNETIKEFVFTVAYGEDVVARSCAGTFKDLGKVIKFFKENEELLVKFTEMQTLNILSGSEEEKECFEAYSKIVEGFKNYKLVTPGNIFQVYHKETHYNYGSIGGELDVAGSFVEESFFNSIVFWKSMVADHHSPNYLHGVKSFCLGYTNSDVIKS